MWKRWRFWLLFATTTIVAAWGIHAYIMQQQMIAAANPPPNYSLIEPGFYLGGRPGRPPDADAVLNLTRERDDYTAPIYQWQPIVDASPLPTLDWLRQQVAWIDTQRHAGRTVFVHCDAGQSRSGMVAAAYYMWRDHLTVLQALDFLRAKRSIVHPNTSFMTLLDQWQTTQQNATTASQP